MKKYYLLSILITLTITSICQPGKLNDITKPRIIMTSDAEIDDECSFVRCLLYSNEFDIEGIITTSSQYHAHDHKWAGDDWYVKYLDAYTQVYPNLIKHDTCYPAPDSLKAIAFLGNVSTEGDMELPSPGSQHIVKVLLDTSDNRPVWLEAWGGMNTIARALKSIEENHPEKMAYVANKIRFFFIWEQDETFQTYIKPVWGKYNILTIISDQFITLFYKWKEYLPAEQQHFLVGSWMNENIKNDHGALCSLYESLSNGDFNSEGDSPSFMHSIPTGLRNMENPAWGGWAGRYTNVRDNIWLDPVAEDGYEYPEGRWYTNTAWGRVRLKLAIPNDTMLTDYLKPIWRWMEAFQNDFASRADWCVKSFDEANHPPHVVLANELNIDTKPGDTLFLSALGTTDPDGDNLTYHWWYYPKAGTYSGSVEIQNSDKQDALLIVPAKYQKGESIHIICEVSDNGSPALTRYQRVIINTNALAYPKNVKAELTNILKIKLSWEYNTTDETGFRIERAKGETGNFETLVDLKSGDTTFVDTLLDELSTYRYRVFAFNDSLSSSFEQTVSATTLSKTSLPIKVSNFSPENKAIDISADTTLLWNASLNANSYNVYFGTDNPPSFVINQSSVEYKPNTLNYGETYYWKINAKNLNGTTEGTLWTFTVKEKITSIQDKVQDEIIHIKNYPNPFSKNTTISYELKHNSELTLLVYNVMGEIVATLVNQWQPAGEHTITLNADNLNSGVYFFSIKTGLVEQRGKLLLIK